MPKLHKPTTKIPDKERCPLCWGAGKIDNIKHAKRNYLVKLFCGLAEDDQAEVIFYAGYLAVQRRRQKSGTLARHDNGDGL